MPPDTGDGFPVESIHDFGDSDQRFEIIDGVLYAGPARPEKYDPAVYDIAGLISWPATGERPPLAGVLRDAYVQLDSRTFVRPDLTLTLLANRIFPPRPIDPRYLLLAVEFVTPWFVDAGRRPKQRAYMRLPAAEYWTVNIEDRRVERWRHGVDIPEVLPIAPDPDAPAYDRFSMFQSIRRELLAPHLIPRRLTGTE